MQQRYFPVFAREITFYVARGEDVTVAQTLANQNFIDRLKFYLADMSNSLNNKTNKFVILKDKMETIKTFVSLILINIVHIHQRGRVSFNST